MKKLFLILISLTITIVNLSADWTQTQSLSNPGSSWDSAFPSNVFIDGNNVIIGDTDYKVGSDYSVGIAYVYKYSGTSWGLELTLTASDGAAWDFFGWAACFNDDFIFVGAVGADTGAVYVFDWEGNQVQKITRSGLPSGTGFGGSVCVQDDYLFIGTNNEDGVYVYHYNGSTWVLEDTLLEVDSITTRVDNFGKAVDVDGDYLAVGSPGNSTSGSYCGCVFIYHWNGTNWELQDNVAFSTPLSYANFGLPVSISGDHLVVGSTNYTQVACYKRTGTEWSHVSSLVPDEGMPDSFGYDVIVEGDYVLVGASQATYDDCDECGAAYLFHWNGVSWDHEQTILDNYPSYCAGFGSCVSMSGNIALIGMYSDRGMGDGQAHFFERPEPGTGDAVGTPAIGESVVVDVEPLDAYNYDGSGAVVVNPDVDVDPEETGASITVDIQVVSGNTEVMVPENASLTYQVTVTGTSQPVEIVLHFAGLPFTPTELVYNHGGTWEFVPGVVWDDIAQTATFSWIFGETRDGSDTFVMNGGEGSTLPVELSSFAASVTASNTVMIEWTTQSESDMMGYYVMRAETEEIDEAFFLNNQIITAENNSIQTDYSFEDADVTSDRTYSYWLQSVEFNGTVGFFGPVTCTVTQGGNEPEAPEASFATSLKGNFPNPFNPSTTVSFSLAEESFVTVEVFNTRGQRVATLLNDSKMTEGIHKVTWDAEGNASGVYFIRMTTDNFTENKRMLLLK